MSRPRGRPAVTRSGCLGPGLPYFCAGSGPPLVLLPGLSGHHRVPEGIELALELGQVRPYAASRTVWWITRRHGLPAGATMADLATDYADVLHELFAEPVDVVGVSTGGSVALQLALDHPECVRRLVLVAGACRLGPTGRAAQREYARLLAAHRPRSAGALLMPLLAARPLTGRLLGALGWVLGPWTAGAADPDMLATIAAEDSFDAGSRLPGLACPLLVVGGGRDRFYGPALFAETAEAAPQGRLVLYRTKGHLGTATDRRLGPDVRSFLDAP
ncbi:alpha/beta fold hydrolase [Kocuria arenosa]|uniref:alpha/beta fold hydrolase n=1 Tax=Kocuria arenosa TaxID=3071446 RepID=UPI0034D60159